MSDSVLYEADGQIVTLTLNRRERLNAVDAEMVERLVEGIARAESDPAVRCIIVTGAGRAFCAGAHISGGSEAFRGGESRTTDPSQQAKFRDPGGKLALKLYACSKPVIAAINGSAAGFGASLTLPMDFRLLADDAKVAFSFTARGIAPDAAASWFLSRVVGLDLALDWCLTARTLTAQEALDARLVRSLHPAADVLNAARELARTIASRTAPVSVALTRRLLWSMAATATPEQAHLAESRALDFTIALPDATEGVTSFFERREPAWTGAVPDDLPAWWPDGES